jgi:hypothetical protein
MVNQGSVGSGRGGIRSENVRDVAALPTPV